VNAKTLRKAIAEAKRFIATANIAQDFFEIGEHHGQYQAAAKRASMDLTRALADLRRPT